MLTASLDDPAEAWEIDTVVTGYIPCGPPAHSTKALNEEQLRVLCDWFDWAMEWLESEWERHFSSLEPPDPFQDLRQQELAADMAAYRKYVSKWRSSL
ncbi:MAG: hypothetical protein H7Y17_03540 [Chlorobia bacterium]|nr:hypothetical protein [Fimbriimonadaceae bacterium]